MGRFHADFDLFRSSRNMVLTSFLLAILLCIACAKDDNVLSPHLTKETFKQYRANNSALAVMFYAPWCGHSQSLLPHWDKSALAVNSDTEAYKGITLAKVNCVDQPTLYWKFEVESFPTILIFTGGEDGLVVPFEGEREMDSIIAFAHSQAVPKALEWTGAAVGADGMLDGGNLLSAGTHAHLAVSSALSADAKATIVRRFDAACKRVNHLSCFYSVAQVDSGGADDNAVSSMTVYEVMEDSSTELSVKPVDSADDIVAMLRLYAYPKVIAFQQELTQDFIFTSDRPGYRNHFILIIKDESSEKSQRILANARATWGAIPGRAVMMYIDVDELTEFQMGILKQVEVDKEEAPIAAAVLSKERAMEFYVNSDGNLDDHQLFQWMSAVLEDLVKPTSEKKFGEDGEELEKD